MSHDATLSDFLAHHGPVIQITLSHVRGSSPRNAGTQMFVSSEALWGTIGGGQLEYRAIEEARAMLKHGTLQHAMTVPLGPDIGQCCGGSVTLEFMRMRNSDKHSAQAQMQAQVAQLPHVYILGAGHVGRALANLFQHVPVVCHLLDERPNEIAQNTAQVEACVSLLAEAEIQNAPKASAFIITTHSHALDFLLASAALGRKDAAYVGMIGSATKRAKFKNWARDHGIAGQVDHLTCPIGGIGSQDKRPSVIAAFVLAEVMGVLTSRLFTSAQTAACEGSIVAAPIATYETNLNKLSHS